MLSGCTHKDKPKAVFSDRNIGQEGLDKQGILDFARKIVDEQTKGGCGKFDMTFENKYNEYVLIRCHGNNEICDDVYFVVIKIIGKNEYKYVDSGVLLGVEMDPSGGNDKTRLPQDEKYVPRQLLKYTPR
jgi:hypothetical protein